MARKVPTPIQQILEEIERLGPQDQQVVIEIARQRLIERRRAEIAQNARAAVQAFREGRAQLRRDISL